MITDARRDNLCRENHKRSATHCARCDESFDDCPEDRDGYCEYCLDLVHGYEAHQAECAAEYLAPGTRRGRS